MKRNYSNDKRKNKNTKKNTNKKIFKNAKHSAEERRQSNYRKRQAKKLNYKKLFFALTVLIVFIILMFLGITKILPKNTKAKPTLTSASVPEPQDITIDMAVIRRYNVSFI